MKDFRDKIGSTGILAVFGQKTMVGELVCGRARNDREGYLEGICARENTETRSFQFGQALMMEHCGVHPQSLVGY